MAGNEPGLDPLQEDARLAALDQRLRRAQSDETVRQGAGRDDGQESYRLGNRVLAELIGGMVGGALIGWLLDTWLDTSPWFLLGLLALGIVAAFRNIIRLSTRRPD